MGIRDIQRKIKLKEEMEKKALELKVAEMESKTRVENFSQERLKKIARSHGVLIALDPGMRAEVEELRKKYNIPKSRVITDQITEDQVLKKKNKVDHQKLGMLAYQRVLFDKEETGGLLVLPEVFNRVNTGLLQGRITLDDVAKAMRILKREKVISGLEVLEDGVVLVSFFPVEYTEDGNQILKIAAGKGFITLEEACTRLNWPEERALRALEKLQESGTARYDSSYLTGRKWFFPGIS
ncbi:MAG: hypothetical protein ACTSU5_16295 [Promethearchaeota archaeon]